MTDDVRIEKMRGGRELLPDMARSLAIILVVWGHSIQYFHGEDYDYWSDMIFKMIYGFHMPLFALVSGYLLSRSIDRYKMSEQILRKARQLLLPCLTWGIVFGCIRLIVDVNHGILFTANTIIMMFGEEILGSYWFLEAVFIGSVSVLVVRKIFHDHYLVYMFLCFTTLLWPGGATIAFVFPYYILGYLYGRRNRKVNIKTWIGLVCTLAYFALIFAYDKEHYVYISGMNVLKAENPLKQIGICAFRFLVGLIGCIGFIGVLDRALHLCDNKRDALLRDIGEHSGIVYILTTPIFLYIKQIFGKGNGTGMQSIAINLLYDAMLFVLSIAMVFCTLKLGKLLCKSRLCARLFFGK